MTVMSIQNVIYVFQEWCEFQHTGHWTCSSKIMQLIYNKIIYVNASVISQYRQLPAYLWLHMSICHWICKFSCHWIAERQINVRIECQIATVGTPDPNIEETHCCHYLQGRTWTRTRRKTHAFARQALLIRSSMWVMPPTILESSCESFGRASTFATPSMGSQILRDGHLWASFKRWRSSCTSSFWVLLVR